MQFQKEHVRDAIVCSAGKEFLEKGYAGASMRDIARDAGVTMSNIYNYFPDKNTLFLEFMKPILTDIRHGKDYLEAMESSETHEGEDAHLEILDAPITYVHHHRKMFELLLFGADGSSLAGFRDETARWFTHLMRHTVEHMIRKHDVSTPPPTDFVLHSIGSVWVNLICESVRSADDIDKIKAEAEQVMRFMYHGLTGMLGITHED